MGESRNTVLCFRMEIGLIYLFIRFPLSVCFFSLSAVENCARAFVSFLDSAFPKVIYITCYLDLVFKYLLQLYGGVVMGAFRSGRGPRHLPTFYMMRSLFACVSVLPIRPILSAAFPASCLVCLPATLSASIMSVCAASLPRMHRN